MAKRSGEGLDELLKRVKSFPNTKGGWSIYDAVVHLSQNDPILHDALSSKGLSFFTLDNEGSHVSRLFQVPKSYYHSLVKAIVFQQLNGAVAEKIFARLLAALGLPPNAILEPHQVANAAFTVGIPTEDDSTDTATVTATATTLSSASPEAVDPSEKPSRKRKAPAVSAPKKRVDGVVKQLCNGRAVGLSVAKARYIESVTAHFMDPTKLMHVDFATCSDEEVFNHLIQVVGLGPWSVHMFMMFELGRPDVLPVGDLALRRSACNLYKLDNKTFESPTGQRRLQERCAAWKPYSTMASMFMYHLLDQ